MANSFLEYLSGSRLYGDDFGPSELREWYESEKQGYFDIYEKDYVRPAYGYHALNHYHGFRFLPPTGFAHVMGFGSGNGDELIPIMSRCDRITIIDPSDQYQSKVVAGTSIDYVQPRIDGHIASADSDFDLICCFSTLHHVPNVSTVLREFYRCLRPGGFALLREPVVSMGDWRRPRRGLTKNERGIPAAVFTKMLESCGFRVVKRKLCMFPLSRYLAGTRRQFAYNYQAVIYIDAVLSTVFSANDRYHPTTILQKLRPMSIFFVLQKEDVRSVSGDAAKHK